MVSTDVHMQQSYVKKHARTKGHSFLILQSTPTRPKKNKKTIGFHPLIVHKFKNSIKSFNKSIISKMLHQKKTRLTTILISCMVEELATLIQLTSPTPETLELIKARISFFIQDHIRMSLTKPCRTYAMSSHATGN